MNHPPDTTYIPVIGPETARALQESVERLSTAVNQLLCDPDGLLTPEQVSQILQVDLRTLQKWAERGEGPEATYLSGKARRYTREALKRFIGERTHSSTVAAREARRKRLDQLGDEED